jgi:hypothetical protein
MVPEILLFWEIFPTFDPRRTFLHRSFIEDFAQRNKSKEKIPPEMTIPDVAFPKKFTSLAPFKTKCHQFQTLGQTAILCRKYHKFAIRLTFDKISIIECTFETLKSALKRPCSSETHGTLTGGTSLKILPPPFKNSEKSCQILKFSQIFVNLGNFL